MRFFRKKYVLSHPLTISWGMCLEYLKKYFAGEFIDPLNYPLRTIDVAVLHVYTELTDWQIHLIPLSEPDLDTLTVIESFLT